MSSVRVFIAITIDESIKSKVSELQNLLKKSSADVKWVKPQNLHLTLHFLGNVEEEKLPRYYQALENSVSSISPFLLRFEGLGVFPERGSPRVLWVGVKGGEKQYIRLHQELSSSLGQALLLKEKEIKKDKISPHLTLGRVRSKKGQDSLMKVFRENKNFYGGEMKIQELHFVKSSLTSTGPIYTTLKSFSF